MNEELKLGSVIWPNFASPLSISCYDRNEDCSILAVGTYEGSILLFKIIEGTKTDSKNNKGNVSEKIEEERNSSCYKNKKNDRNVEHKVGKNFHGDRDFTNTNKQKDNERNEQNEYNDSKGGSSKLALDGKSLNMSNAYEEIFIRNPKKHSDKNFKNNNLLNEAIINNIRNGNKNNILIGRKQCEFIRNDVNLLPYSVLLSSEDLCNIPVLQLNFGLSCSSLVECVSKEFLISLHGNNAIHFWSLDEGRCFRVLKNFDFFIYNLRILSDRRYLLISGKRQVQLIDLWAQKNKEVIACLLIEKENNESNEDDRYKDKGREKGGKTDIERIKRKFRRRIYRKERNDYGCLNENVEGEEYEAYHTYIVESTDWQYMSEDTEAEEKEGEKDEEKREEGKKEKKEEIYTKEKSILTSIRQNQNFKKKSINFNENNRNYNGINSLNSINGINSINSITNVTKENKKVISIATGVVPYLKEKNQRSLIQCCKLLKRKLFSFGENEGEVMDPLNDLLNYEAADFSYENRNDKTNEKDEEQLKEKYFKMKEDEINKKFNNLFYSPVLVCALLNTGEVLCWDLTEFLNFYKSQCRFVLRTEKTESEMFNELVQDIGETCAYDDFLKRKMNLSHETDTKVEEKNKKNKEMVFKKKGKTYVVEPITIAVFPQGDQMAEIATTGNSNRINIIDNYIILLQKNRLIIFEKKEMENSSFFIPLMDIFCPDYENDTKYSKRRKTYIRRRNQPHWVGIQVLRRPVWKFASGVFKNSHSKNKYFNILQKISKNVYGCIVAWTTEGNFYYYTLPLKFSSIFLSFQLNMKSYFLGSVPRELLGSFHNPSPFIIYKDDIFKEAEKETDEDNEISVGCESGKKELYKKNNFLKHSKQSVLKNNSNNEDEPSKTYNTVTEEIEKKKKKMKKCSKGNSKGDFKKYAQCKENLIFFFINEKQMNRIVIFENIRNCWFQTEEIDKVWLLPPINESLKIETGKIETGKKANIVKNETKMQISTNVMRNEIYRGVSNSEVRLNVDMKNKNMSRGSMDKVVIGNMGRVATYTVGEYYLNIYVVISYLNGTVTGTVVNSYRNKNRKKLVYDFPFPKGNYWKRDMFITTLFFEDDLIIGGSNKGDLLMWKLPKCDLVKYLKKCHMSYVSSIYKVFNANFVLDRLQEIRDEGEKEYMKNEKSMMKNEGKIDTQKNTKYEGKKEISVSSHTDNYDSDKNNEYIDEKNWERKIDPFFLEKENSFILTTDSSNNLILLNINKKYFSHGKSLFFCQNDECSLAIESDGTQYDTISVTTVGGNLGEEKKRKCDRSSEIVHILEKNIQNVRETKTKDSSTLIKQEIRNSRSSVTYKKRKEKKKTREKFENEIIRKNKTHVCFHCSFKRLEKKNEITFKLIKKIYINTYTSLLYIMLLNNYVCIYNCNSGLFLRTAYDPEFINTATNNSSFLFFSRLGVSLGGINILNKIKWQSKKGLCESISQNKSKRNETNNDENDSDEASDYTDIPIDPEIKKEFCDISVITNSLRNATKYQEKIKRENKEMENWTSDYTDVNSNTSSTCPYEKGSYDTSKAESVVASKSMLEDCDMSDDVSLSQYLCSNENEEESEKEQKESEKIREFYRKRIVESKMGRQKKFKRFNKCVYIVKSQIPVISFLLFRDKNLSKKALPLTQFLYHFFISQSSVNICKQLFPFLRSFPFLYFSLCVFGADSSFSLIIPLCTQTYYFSKMISKETNKETCRLYDCNFCRGDYYSYWSYRNSSKFLKRRKKMKMKNARCYFVSDYLNLDNVWLKKNWRRNIFFNGQSKEKYYILDLHLGNSKLRKIQRGEKVHVNSHFNVKKTDVGKKISPVFNNIKNSSIKEKNSNYYSLNEKEKKQISYIIRSCSNNYFAVHKNDMKPSVVLNDNLSPLGKCMHYDTTSDREKGNLSFDKIKNKGYGKFCFSFEDNFKGNFKGNFKDNFKDNYEDNSLYVMKKGISESHSSSFPFVFSDYSDDSSLCLYVKKEKKRKKKKKRKGMTKSKQFPIEENINIDLESPFVKTLYCCFMLRFINLWCFNSRRKYKDSILINFKKHIINNLIEYNEINLFLLSYISMYPYNKNIRVQLQHFMCRVLSKLNSKHVDKYAKTSAEVLRINNKKKRITEKSIDEICLYDINCTSIISITIPKMGCLFLYPYIYADEICLTFLLLVLYAKTEYLKKAKTFYSNTNMMALLIHHICYYIFVGTEYFMDKTNQYKKFKLFHFIHLLSLSYSITWDLSILTQKGIFTTHMKNKSSPSLNLNLKSEDFVFNETIVHRSYIRALKNTLSPSEFEKYMEISSQSNENKESYISLNTTREKSKNIRNDATTKLNNNKKLRGVISSRSVNNYNNSEEETMEKNGSSEAFSRNLENDNTNLKNNNYTTSKDKKMFISEGSKFAKSKDTIHAFNKSDESVDAKVEHSANHSPQNNANWQKNNLKCPASYANEYAEVPSNENVDAYKEYVYDKEFESDKEYNDGNNDNDNNDNNNNDKNDKNNNDSDNDNNNDDNNNKNNNIGNSFREEQNYLVIRARKQLINEHNYLNICHFILNIFELYSISLNNVAFLKILINTGRIEPFLFLKTLNYITTNLQKSVTYINKILFIIITLIKNYKTIFVHYLNLIIDILLNALDPSNNVRSMCLKLSTSLIYTLVKKYQICAFNKLTQKLAVANNINNFIYLYDLKNARKYKIFQGHRETINCINFNTDGSYLASYSKLDLTFRLWNCINVGLFSGFLKIHSKCSKEVLLPKLKTHYGNIRFSDTFIEIIYIKKNEWILRREDNINYSMIF